MKQSSRRKGGAECNPKADDVYRNLREPCPVLCGSDGNPLHYLQIQPGKRILPDVYLYVIRKSEPTILYYYPNYEPGDESKTEFLYLQVCPNQNVRYSEWDIHHNCIAKNEEVLAAGSFSVLQNDPTTLYMNEQSGHYRPRVSSMEYVKCLIEKMGFRFVYEPYPREKFLGMNV